MKIKLRLASLDLFLLGSTIGFGTWKWFDGIVQKRARRMLANPVWEAEQLTRESAGSQR